MSGDLTVEHLRKFIEELKETANTLGYESGADLAQTWFEHNENGHKNWSLLSDEVKEMFITFANVAVYEMETGNIVPNS